MISPRTSFRKKVARLSILLKREASPATDGVELHRNPHSYHVRAVTQQKYSEGIKWTGSSWLWMCQIGRSFEDRL